MTLRELFIQWLTTDAMRSRQAASFVRLEKDVEHWKAVVKEAQDCIDLANYTADKADYRRNLAVRLELEARRVASQAEKYALEQKQQFTERLGEKDAIIRLLRTEVASLKLECDRMRSVLIPLSSPAGAAYAQRFDTQQKPPAVPAFQGPDDWTAELNKMLEEERNGVQQQRREEIHEQASDESA